jgi:hypothetical protein
VWEQNVGKLLGAGSWVEVRCENDRSGGSHGNSSEFDRTLFGR